jgi:hypothetical protein
MLALKTIKESARICIPRTVGSQTPGMDVERTGTANVSKAAPKNRK